MNTITLDPRLIEAIAAHHDEALRLIENQFHVRLAARGNEVTIAAEGEPDGDRVAAVTDLLRQLAGLNDRGVPLGRNELRTAVALKRRDPGVRLLDHFVDARIDTSVKKSVVPKSTNQLHYVESIRDNDLVFGIGPAGTGKTYLAVAMAVSLLNAKPRPAHHSRPTGGRGRRAARVPARGHRGEGRSVPATRCTTRCTTCSSRRGPSA